MRLFDIKHVAQYGRLILFAKRVDAYSVAQTLVYATEVHRCTYHVIGQNGVCWISFFQCSIFVRHNSPGRLKICYSNL